MNEYQLRKLIESGENESVDFKRELHLETSAQKAEFVKDLIALANSATHQGYLLIGVENNGALFGIENIPDERIQQIAQTYIYPILILKCFQIPLNGIKVGVIETKGLEKPHRVIKEIDRLIVNDVFVRHGSTTAKASPEEILRMRHRETEIEREVQSLKYSGDQHVRLENIEQAVAAYAKAIDLFPTPELFLARGKARLKIFEKDPDGTFSGFLDVNIGEESLKDFSNALTIQNSLALEKDVRLARLELLSICPINDTCWDDDFVWVEENCSDSEFCVVLFWAALKINTYTTYTSEGWDADQIVKLLNQATELGYTDPKAYCLRAIAHHSNQNLGLALNDINRAYGMIKNNQPLLKDSLVIRAGILKSMGQYESAYDDIKTANNIKLPFRSDHRASGPYLGDIHRLKDEIYQRVAIHWEFKSSSSGYRKDIYKTILSILLLDDGLPQYIHFDNNQPPQEFYRGISVEKEFPMLSPIIKKIVGPDIWQAAKQGRGFQVNITLKDAL